MANRNIGLTSNRNPPTCPHCQRKPSFVCSWSYRGLWGYNEVDTYECPEHGPIFVNPPTLAVSVPLKRRDSGRNYGDRDSLVWAPRRPTPTLSSDAVAMPEPDAD